MIPAGAAARDMVGGEEGEAYFPELPGTKKAKT